MFFEIIVPMLGGLALFLYGMNIMSSNLEAIAGNRLKRWIERLTSNRILGVLVGAGITAIIQSSSATTVMVVGFVNSGLMTLAQSVWIIMGANIGTTVTGLLVALDIGMIAPLICFLGVGVFIFVSSKKWKNAGAIVAGLGMLFIGLNMMSDAMYPLRDNAAFTGLLTKFSNPVLGILVGALFTAVIQSSSASVGILQALAMSGLIGLDGAVFVLFGQNIGTCITAVLASVGANRNAKRTTLIHLMFNVIGTMVFVLITLLTPFTDWMVKLFPTSPSAQIANVHVIFNIATTLLLLPFGRYLAALACKILPDKKAGRKGRSSEDKWFEEILGNRHVLGASVIAEQSLREELVRMMSVAAENVTDAFVCAEKNDLSLLERIRLREEEIDRINYDISKKISKVLAIEQSLSTVRVLNGIFRASSNVERIGDHALNMAEYAETLKEKDMAFSEQAQREIVEMREACGAAMHLLASFNGENSAEVMAGIAAFEQSTDDMTSAYRENQNERIRTGAVATESLLIYSELLVDFERIGDHALNIAEELSGLEWKKADAMSAPNGEITDNTDAVTE